MVAIWQIRSGRIDQGESADVHAEILPELEQIGRRWSESTDLRVDLVTVIGVLRSV
jgi:hypothetical protein